MPSSNRYKNTKTIDRDTLNINALCFIYKAWCKENNLPLLSADDQLVDDNCSQGLTKEQKIFLESFITLWDYATNLINDIGVVAFLEVQA